MGFYIVNYDELTWLALARQLNENHKVSIPEKSLFSKFRKIFRKTCIVLFDISKIASPHNVMLLNFFFIF